MNKNTDYFEQREIKRLSEKGKINFTGNFETMEKVVPLVALEKYKRDNFEFITNYSANTGNFDFFVIRANNRLFVVPDEYKTELAENKRKKNAEKVQQMKIAEQWERYLSKFDVVQKHKDKQTELKQAFADFERELEKKNHNPRFIEKPIYKDVDFNGNFERVKFTLNTYGDMILDELVKGLLFAFCAQINKQPERAGFWKLKMYELISNNLKGELNNEFIGDAYIKFFSFDEKERNADIAKFARKSAHNAIYQYKYKGDGKSLSTGKDDIAKVAQTSDNTFIFIIATESYLLKKERERKTETIERFIEKLTEKQSYCIKFYLLNVIEFNTLQDIYDFGKDETGNKIKFFKNYDSFKRTFYNAKKAIKEIGNAPDFEKVLSACYQNKTYNAEILSAKYEKAKKESDEREKERIASEPATDWIKPGTAEYIAIMER